MKICKIDLPNGIYDAVWGGSTLKINNKDFKTDVAVKTPRLEAKIYVHEGEAFYNKSNAL